MTATDKATLIKENIPLIEETAYLNTGSTGPVSAVGHEAMQRLALAELREGRSTMTGWKAYMETKTQALESIATLVKATPAEICLTHHTTEGMNIAMHGLNWQAGDEIITTNLEHPGGFMPPFVLRQRYGAVVKVVHLSPTDSDNDIIAKFEEAISPKTRLLVFSHVAWNTGQLLPLSEITALAHRHHAMCVVDGAQSTGAIPLDLPASRVDFYAMPGQKWLGGPEGTGFLYVRKDRLNILGQTFAGFLSLKDPRAFDWTGNFLPKPNASRYEIGTVYRPAIVGLAAQLAWLQNTIGWNWIFERIQNLAGYAADNLSKANKVSLITPSPPPAGLITFTLAGFDPARVTLKLAEMGIILRFIDDPHALRISTGFYNSEADIDRLISALQEISASDPDSLPVFTPPW